MLSSLVLSRWAVAITTGGAFEIIFCVGLEVPGAPKRNSGGTGVSYGFLLVCWVVVFWKGHKKKTYRFFGVEVSLLSFYLFQKNVQLQFNTVDGRNPLHTSWDGWNPIGKPADKPSTPTHAKCIVSIPSIMDPENKELWGGGIHHEPLKKASSRA